MPAPGRRDGGRAIEDLAHRETAWGLPDHLVQKWWRSLHPDDAQAFTELGGDEELARFVFAYQYLVLHDKADPISARTEAYAAAARLSHADASLPGRTESAWSHPAVAELVTRFHDRSRREIGRRIATKYAGLIEKMVEEASLPGVEVDDRVKVADATIKWLKLISVEEGLEKKIRSKRAERTGMLRRVNPDNEGAPDAHVAGFLRMIAEKHPDKLAELQGQTEASE